MIGRNLDKNKIIWLLLAILSLTAALIGVLNPSIYSGVIAPDIMPGVISQDITTIAASILIIFCVLGSKEEGVNEQIVILGIIAYLFYAYGIYVIERVYNMLYFVYMAVFGLSFYSLIYAVASIRGEITEKAVQSKLMRNISVGFLLLIPLIFYTLWVAQLFPLIQTGQKIEFFYSVYILDLCFIMPAFLIIAGMTIKQKGLGLLLTPVLFILGFTLLFPVGMGEIFKPAYNLSMDMGGMYFFLGLSFLFLIMAVLCLRNLE